MEVRGLEGDRFVLEGFRFVPDGGIHRVAGEMPAAKNGRRKEAGRGTAMVKAAQPLPLNRKLDARVNTSHAC